MENTFSTKVPELFYDLIGRVIPGCVFILGAGGIWWDRIKAWNLPFDDKTGWIVVLVAGYVAGITLDLLGSLLEVPLNHLQHRHGKSNLWPPSPNHQWRLARCHQRLGHHRLLKIRAEILFFRSMALSLIALWIFLPDSHRFPHHGHWLAAGVVACVLFMWKLGMAFSEKQIELSEEEKKIAARMVVFAPVCCRHRSEDHRG